MTNITITIAFNDAIVKNIPLLLIFLQVWLEIQTLTRILPETQAISGPIGRPKTNSLYVESFFRAPKFVCLQMNFF